MLRMFRTRGYFGLVFMGLFFIVGCVGGGEEADGGNNNDDGDGGGNEEAFSSGECDGFCGTEQTKVSVNLSGARALFTVESDSGETNAALVKTLGTKNIQLTTSSPLYAVTDEGIQGILTAFDPAGENAVNGLPRLSFVAVSPIGEVLLAFEHPWIYRSCFMSETGEDCAEDAEDDDTMIQLHEYSDPWAPSSPFTCQLYVVDQLIGQAEDEEADTSEPNISCVKNDIEINTWDSRTRQIQFDDAGNAYFAGHIPGNWKDVLYKYSTHHSAPQTLVKSLTIDESQLTEMINANICFHRFLVTNQGAILYTGTTSTDSMCNGEPFFRMITPEGALHQITSGWWDYTFAAIEEPLANGEEGNDYLVGQVLFYGPDPLSALAPEWDDSCLFRFDSEADGEDRATQIADCNIDIWRYIELDEDGNNNSEDVRQAHCEETKSMMGGGNVPHKILLADYMEGDGLNEIYVVGDIYEKTGNEWRCDLCTIEDMQDSYCVVGDQLRFDLDSEDDCVAEAGSWQQDGGCFHSQVDSDDTGNVCNQDGLPANWNVTSERCEFSGDNARETRSALARVDEGDTEADHQITRLSSDDDIVDNGWVVDGRIVYLSFNALEGHYELIEVGNGVPLMTGIEVYELMPDPRSDYEGNWFFNGLKFDNNQYVFGTFNPDADDPAQTLVLEEGITGQVETLVIVPSL